MQRNRESMAISRLPWNVTPRPGSLALSRLPWNVTPETWLACFSSTDSVGNHECSAIAKARQYPGFHGMSPRDLAHLQYPEAWNVTTETWLTCFCSKDSVGKMGNHECNAIARARQYPGFHGMSPRDLAHLQFPGFHGMSPLRPGSLVSVQKIV